ncbi:Uncharacterised protein [Sphingobacterium multivorum]|nr:Uncharacterised protein [Sphingobacterium multivorum]
MYLVGRILLAKVGIIFEKKLGLISKVSSKNLRKKSRINEFILLSSKLIFIKKYTLLLTAFAK